MILKSCLFAFLVLFICFNQPTLGDHNTYKPECNGTKPKYTYNEAFNICAKTHFITWSIKECAAKKMKDELVETKVCCPGFKATGNDTCVEDCDERCKHGECHEDRCSSCAIGFGGVWCDKPCPAGHFGTECEHNCECLTSQECNPNYQHCKCNEDNIAAECDLICKCRFNLCNPGLMGKNCSVPCPDGSYGHFCSKTCSCVDQNTRECLKEFGECVCKDGFYGMHCERECTGVLKCDKPNLCTCELSLEQKVEHVSRTRSYLMVGLAVTVVLLIVALSMVFRYKIKSKRLKNELKNYSLRYSGDCSNVTLSNPFYSTNLLDTCSLPVTNLGDTPQSTKARFLDALKSNSLFNKMNSMSKDWLKAKKSGQPFNAEEINKKPAENEENAENYSSIDELDDVTSEKTKKTKNDLDYLG